jgi:hypothetical protein
MYPHKEKMKLYERNVMLYVSDISNIVQVWKLLSE